MDSKGERPGEPCDPDCEWVSGRPHWNFKERLVFLDCSDGCLGSCLVILALPASECPLGASESGSVILGRLRTAAWHALDFQKAHQAFIKRSFSKGTCTVLPASVEICSGSWILDFRNTCLLWCYRLKMWAREGRRGRGEGERWAEGGARARGRPSMRAGSLRAREGGCGAGCAHLGDDLDPLGPSMSKRT